ncbi:MAG: SDR family NAD(P)-dependent oxidoreductase [Proteobacteria bacterium]|nr:SDR family NAD(P)-dependent oxidoreductase [Pseudomonadota bacterium]
MQYQCALITGATSGLGESFARQLPQQATLLLTGRNLKKLEELREELSKNGRKVEIFPADVADAEQRKALAEWANGFEVDLFINNAGYGFYGPVLDNSIANEEGMTQVNVVATTYLTRALLSGMVERAHTNHRRAGMIVVASVAGFMPLPCFATYAATKAYNLHYTEALAEELKHLPIDVMALCPGPTATSFGRTASMGKEFDTKAASADDVVKLALASLGRKRICVPGLRNSLATCLPRLFPRRLVVWLGGVTMRRNRPVQG